MEFKTVYGYHGNTTGNPMAKTGNAATIT